MRPYAELVPCGQRNETSVASSSAVSSAKALEPRDFFSIKPDDPWHVVGGRCHDSCNGVTYVILGAIRRVVDCVATGSTCTALKPEELQDSARIIEQVDTARIQHRQESEIDFALVLLGRLIRYSVGRKSFPRPFASVAVSGHRRDAIDFQRLRELNDDAVGTERRLPLGDTIENRPIVFAVRNRERHAVA